MSVPAAAVHRGLRLLAIAMAGAMLLAACGSSADDADAATSDSGGEEAAPLEEAAFPSFTAPTVQGDQLDFGSLEGSDIVVWFWAPW